MPRAPEARLPQDRLPQDRLIVALDVDSLDPAAALVDALHGTARRFKIGSQLFTAVGPAAVEAVRKRGGEVFLDLKFHDIPNTVEGAAREAVQGAREAAQTLGLPRPLVLAVTVLTSLDRQALASELRVASSVEGHVLHLCGLAQEAGLDGNIASPHEIAAIRRAMGARWAIVTPGVRPAGSETNDQSRIATPRAAAGADYLVVGRPITAAADPAKAAAAILEEMRA